MRESPRPTTSEQEEVRLGTHWGHWVSVGKMLLSLKEGGVGGGPGSGRHHGTA